MSYSPFSKARLPRCVLAFFATANLAAPCMVSADEIEGATGKLIDLDQQSHILSLEFREAPKISADRMLVEAQVLVQLKKYDEAAILLFEVLEKWPTSRAADDGAFLLADSLFELEYYDAARFQYEQALRSFTASVHIQAALDHLMQIARRTGDFDLVSSHLDRLSKLPKCEPWVPYFKAKNLYFRGRYDQALTAFAAIPATSPFRLRALYFSATMKVRDGNLDGAMAAFFAMLTPVSGDEDGREIQNFARLGLGRILYAQGDFGRAVEMYRAISATPTYLPDALNELGWSLVKLNRLREARDNFVLFLKADPNSAQAPELKLLIGNLNVRLGDMFLARRAFEETQNQFQDAHVLVRQALAAGVTTQPVLFHAVVGAGPESLATLISPQASAWVQASPVVVRLVKIFREVAEIRSLIEEVTVTLAELDGVLARQDKVGIFSDLSGERDAARKILKDMQVVQRDVTLSYAAPSSVGIFQESVTRVEAIESQILAFDRRVGDEASKRATLTTAQLADERDHLEIETANIESIDRALQIVGPALMGPVMADIDRRLAELLIGADAGMLDVAWGLKMVETKAIAKLVSRRNREEHIVKAELRRKLAELELRFRR